MGNLLADMPSTRPEDKRILEDAYARNPKPTKEERKALVNLVSLSEKAIQVRTYRYPTPSEAAWVQQRVSRFSLGVKDANWRGRSCILLGKLTDPP